MPESLVSASMVYASTRNFKTTVEGNPEIDKTYYFNVDHAYMSTRRLHICDIEDHNITRSIAVFVPLTVQLLEAACAAY